MTPKELSENLKAQAKQLENTLSDLKREGCFDEKHWQVIHLYFNQVKLIVGNYEIPFQLKKYPDTYRVITDTIKPNLEKIATISEKKSPPPNIVKTPGSRLKI